MERLTANYAESLGYWTLPVGKTGSISIDERDVQDWNGDLFVEVGGDL